MITSIKSVVLYSAIAMLLLGCGEKVCIQNPYTLKGAKWSTKIQLDTLIYQDSFRLQVHYSWMEYRGAKYKNYDSVSITKKEANDWKLQHKTLVDTEEEYVGYFCMDMNEDWYDDIVVRFYAGAKGFYQDYIFLYNSQTKQYDFLGEDYLAYPGSWREPTRLCLKSNYYHSLHWDLSDDSYAGYLWKIEDTSYYPLAEMVYYPTAGSQAYIYKITAEDERILVDSTSIKNHKEDAVVRMQMRHYWNKKIDLLDK